MTDFGTIRSYDSARGTGTIAPESGGDVLPFRKGDLQQQEEVPQLDARFGYIIQKGDGGHRRAVNLHPQDIVEGPAEDKQRYQARHQQG